MQALLHRKSENYPNKIQNTVKVILNIINVSSFSYDDKIS